MRWKQIVQAHRFILDFNRSTKKNQNVIIDDYIQFKWITTEYTDYGYFFLFILKINTHYPNGKKKDREI